MEIQMLAGLRKDHNASLRSSTPNLQLSGPNTKPLHRAYLNIPNHPRPTLAASSVQGSQNVSSICMSRYRSTAALA